ncbi:MAG: ABC transporter substrate-binding protein [Treponema sp.]|nr:ABC transporter substrate-binding protein [Treponema sp.]
MVKKFFLLSLTLLFFVSCQKEPGKSELPQISGFTYSRTLSLDYAKTFKIYDYENSSGESLSLISVYPSDFYLLLPEGFSIPEKLSSQIKVINLPVKNAFLSASSAMALISRINALPSLRFSAIQEKDWYVNEAVTAMKNGSLLYAGKYNAPDFELLMKENPSLAIESTMIYHAPQIYEKLESLGIPVFVDKSSYEESPLGRMEWVKLYGKIFGKEKEADSFFESEVSKIQDIIYKKDENPAKKVAFFYITANGMLVIRGEDDYIVKMIEMAGGEYAFSKTRKSSSPSVTISMEQFYSQCADCDILIYNSSIDNSLSSIDDLLSKSSLFADFKAVKKGEVWITGRYLYQASDRLGDMILDLHKIISGEEGELYFLSKVK